jgi:hypothetical protein
MEFSRLAVILKLGQDSTTPIKMKPMPLTKIISTKTRLRLGLILIPKAKPKLSFVKPIQFFLFKKGVWGLGFGVWGLGFGVWGLGFGVWGLGFGVWGLGFGVWV